MAGLSGADPRLRGPEPEPLLSEVQHDGNTDFIVVTTGGPFLLILGFSGDRVISANWLGQRLGEAGARIPALG